MTKKSLCLMNHRNLLGLFRGRHRRCSVKKGAPKKFPNFTGKYLCWSLFLIKHSGQKLHEKETPTLAFSCKICEIFKNIYESLLLFVSPQNTIANSSGEFGLDETLTDSIVSIFFKHNNFISSNAAISLIYKLQNVSLTFQLSFLLNF